MLWFALGLLIGNFLGMLLLGVFVAKKRPEWLYDDAALHDRDSSLKKKRMADCLTIDLTE